MSCYQHVWGQLRGVHHGNPNSFHFVKTLQGLCLNKFCIRVREAWGQSTLLSHTLTSGKPLAVSNCCSYCGLLLVVETCHTFSEMLWNLHVCRYPPKMVILDNIKCFWIVNKAHDQWVIVLSTFFSDLMDIHYLVMHASASLKPVCCSDSSVCTHHFLRSWIMESRTLLTCDCKLWNKIKTVVVETTKAHFLKSQDWTASWLTEKVFELAKKWQSEREWLGDGRT